MSKHSTVLADTNVGKSLKTVLSEHFGDEGSWGVTYIGKGVVRIELSQGDLMVYPGDTVHIKNTSVLVEVGPNHV